MYLKWPTGKTTSVLFLFFAITPGVSHSLNLSQQSVVRIILENSLEYKKIQSDEKARWIDTASAEAFLDWRFFLQADLNSREQNTLNFFENPLKETWTVSSGLKKAFLTGTHVKFQYSYLQMDTEFNPEFKKISNPPTATARQSLKWEVQQDLLRNIFGYEDRMKLNIAYARTEQKRIKLLEEKEDLILKAIQQFWLSYISHLSLQQKVLKKKDYADLFRITKQKKKYGYIRPGELSQIQAEWEKAKQEQILQKKDHEDQLAKLFNLLNVQQTNKVHFIIDNHLPPPPTFKEDLPQTPRTVLLMKKNLFIQEQQLKIQKAGARPTLKLFGFYEIGGYDRNFSSSFEGLTEAKNQNHSFGVKFSYPLPATRTRRKRVDWSEHAVEASQLELEITKKEFERLKDSTQKQLQSLYMALKSAEKIHRLRTQSYSEVRKAFSQGRLNVFELITAKEFSLLSEIEKVLLKSQYHQALAYAQAVRDRLIKKDAQN